jgi:hypothetical protein
MGPPRSAAGLRPLSGLVGRSGDLARVLGHLDSGRSIHLQAVRGAGVTALLRSLCAEQPRPSTPDGVLALPSGLPLPDLTEVAYRLLPEASRPLPALRLLVLLDERGLEPRDVLLLQQMLPSSLLVVTGHPGADPGDLTPVPLQGLSEHHAVGLMEAAVGRPFSLDEGRAARWVAGALGGLPTWLVQAAAAVRDGGLTFSEIRGLLDDPPRPAALTVALQNALGDDLHPVLSALRAFDTVPVPESALAAATALDPAEAIRRVRRLSVLGLAMSDGRDGWTAAAGVSVVPEPVRAGVAERLATWLPQQPVESLGLAVTAAVLDAVGDRVAGHDLDGAGGLARAALRTLPLDRLDQTRVLLDQTLLWSGTDMLAGSDAPTVVNDEETAPGTTLVGEPEESPTAGDGPAQEPDVTPAPVLDAGDLTAPGDLTAATSSRLASLLSDWRRLAIIAVAAAAVVAGVLVAAPMLRAADPASEPLRGAVDLGSTSVGSTAGGVVQLDLSGRDAVLPVSLVLSGPDADAFVLDPTRCDAVDCRASVSFTADRTGAHLATVTATDRAGVDQAIVELSGKGSQDPPAAPAETDLAVTLFPAEPSPLPAGGQGVIPVGVRNLGPDDSTSARLVLTLPAGVTARAPGCTFQGADPGRLTCTLAELAAGDQLITRVTLGLPEAVRAVQVGATVASTSDSDPADGDNAAGFTYPVRPPQG